MQYPQEALDLLSQQVEEIDSKVIDGGIYLPVDIIEQIVGLIYLNLGNWSQENTVCENEYVHTLMTIDFLQKLVTTFELKHPDAVVPENISELFDERPGPDSDNSDTDSGNLGESS